MKRDYKGKRLLILGGAFQHEKLVEAAKKLGIYTAVTDNIENSPAKRIADKAYNIDIFDIRELLKLCEKERIDGVVATSLDPCQNPYVELCEKAGYFCYGTKEQFRIMTNKAEFKKKCRETGVEVVPDYNISKLESYGENIFPIIIKPVDSRGSRGQTICNSLEETIRALEVAKENSASGHCIVEKYLDEWDFFQVTYFCINGKPYLIRTADGYCGSREMGLNRVISCAVSPSKYTKQYLKKVHNDVVRFIRAVGIVNGPIFMQGIVKEGKFLFFDPGLRFPGVDYERIYKNLYGIDLMKAMVDIALWGECEEICIPKDSVWLLGKRAAILFPFLSPGEIKNTVNKEEIMQNKNVISYLPRYGKGEIVPSVYDIRRRHSEIDILSDSTDELKKSIDKIISNLKVEDKNGENMLCDIFDSSLIL